MDLGLQDKVAVVTAASRGLGKAAALELSNQGAQVAICARTEQIFETAREIETISSNRVFAKRTDLRNKDSIKQFIQETQEQFGQIDILVINAGGPPSGDFLSLEMDDWEAAVQLTLMSAVQLCYETIPLMMDAGSGSIVAIQSFSVKEPVPNLMLSNSIRLAVIGMMKSLATELGPHGIRVNSINPAWTSTERVEELLQARSEKNSTSLIEESARVVEGIPLGRMGTVEEFGRTVAWLASPAASFIHGHALMFDGGGVHSPI
jgi:3-oxoacyl-[acyl-carrier protein] reductase